MISDPLIGKKLGAYHILEKIGQGGMADIYKGRHAKNNSYVAIKVVGQQLPADPDLTQRFRREARAARALKHPNIITVHGYGEHGGGHYMVMEYVEGTNLQRRIKYRTSRKQKFTPHEIVTLIDDIATALDFAHKQGIIHRDVKPSNILLPKRSGAILTDFGLVMLQDRASQQTRGESFGTPEYIAPEQAIDSRRATRRSDVYSLGVLLYELATGHLPFDADSAISLALMHIGQTPTRPRQHAPTMPIAVEKVILKTMAKEPSKRYASAGALARALRAAYGEKATAPAISRRPPKRRPTPTRSQQKRKRAATTHSRGKRRLKSRLNRRVIVGVALLLLLIGVASFLLMRQDDNPLTAVSLDIQSETPSKAQGAQQRPADGMTMHLIPGGTFLMGSTANDPDARPHERPQHAVDLSPFWLDQTEVTNDQYRLCVNAGACEPPVLRKLFDNPTLADHPVVYVRWDQATAYCAWLAGETGWPVALPTEAQWEKAAAWDPKAERHRLYPWGDDAPGGDRANLVGSGLNKTTAVGSYPDGAGYYGSLDLAGNVWEWVADWYDQDYYARTDLPPNPTGPVSASQHVMRGGSFGFGAVEARTANRTAGSSQANGVGLGFRCAVNAEDLPKP